MSNKWIGLWFGASLGMLILIPAVILLGLPVAVPALLFGSVISFLIGTNIYDARRSLK